MASTFSVTVDKRFAIAAFPGRAGNAVLLETSTNYVLVSARPACRPSHEQFAWIRFRSAEPGHYCRTEAANLLKYLLRQTAGVATDRRGIITVIVQPWHALPIARALITFLEKDPVKEDIFKWSICSGYESGVIPFRPVLEFPRFWAELMDLPENHGWGIEVYTNVEASDDVTIVFRGETAEYWYAASRGLVVWTHSDGDPWEI